MKMFNAILAVVMMVSANAMASQEESEQWCLEFSTARLAKHVGHAEKDVKFHSSAILGDGINSIEVDVFQVEGLSGLYKVDTLIDGCEALGTVLHINN